MRARDQNVLIRNFYRRNPFFVLDSSHPSSLTLRDYSKVVAGHKLSFSKNQPNSPGCLEAPCRHGGIAGTVCLAVTVCLSFSPMLFAQGTGGRILGRVSDPQGAVLGAKVTLVNEGTNVSRDTTTNANGDYDFVEVPVGTYRVEFDLKGFKKNVRRSVALDINQVITLNMTMQVGAAQEVVDVTSEAPLVETTSTHSGAVVGDRTVSELPLNSRDTYQLLQLQPGVMSTVGSSNSIVYGSNNAGAVSVNGGRGRSNNFSVNGGDANDQFVNLPTVQPSPDSIAEFRVLTNTFDAEYGRNSGSVVNVVTKSGTNDFHGNLYEFFSNTVLNASSYCFSAPCEKPKFNQNQFGGTFGGPIKKDRTFFFASYEGRRIRQGISSPVVTVPTPRVAGTLKRRRRAFPIFLGPISRHLAEFLRATTGHRPGQRSGCQAAVNAIGGGTIADGVAYSDLSRTIRFHLLVWIPPPSTSCNSCQRPRAEAIRCKLHLCNQSKAISLRSSSTIASATARTSAATTIWTITASFCRFAQFQARRR